MVRRIAELSDLPIGLRTTHGRSARSIPSNSLNVCALQQSDLRLGSGFARILDFSTLQSGCHRAPPAREQAAIVRFLDWANGRLERAIRAKRKVIALLNEQKQAIIHRAVTRGLDPSVPLKPSGIPWLGDIPQHWEVVRSRRLFTARKELARPNDVQLSATQAYGVIPQNKFERRVRAQGCQNLHASR